GAPPREPSSGEGSQGSQSQQEYPPRGANGRPDPAHEKIQVGAWGELRTLGGKLDASQEFVRHLEGLLRALANLLHLVEPLAKPHRLGLLGAQLLLQRLEALFEGTCVLAELAELFELSLGFLPCRKRFAQSRFGA